MISKKIIVLIVFLLSFSNYAAGAAWGVGKERLFYSEEHKISTPDVGLSVFKNFHPYIYQENKFFEYGLTEYLNIGYQNILEKIIFREIFSPILTSNRISASVKIHRAFKDYSFALKLSGGRQRFSSIRASFSNLSLSAGKSFRLFERNNFFEIEISREKSSYFSNFKRYDLLYGIKSTNGFNMIKLSFLPRNKFREIAFSKSLDIDSYCSIVAGFFLTRYQNFDARSRDKLFHQKGISISVWKKL